MINDNEQEIENGLSAREVKEARGRFGLNSLTRKKRKGFLRSLLANFGDPMIRILLIALGINVIVLWSHINWFETLGIASAILIFSPIPTSLEPNCSVLLRIRMSRRII
jgi:magnesium-transporting ATPase (P-type)